MAPQTVFGLLAVLVITGTTWIHSASACGGLYTGVKGMLSSPGYPASYPPNQDCVSIIQRPQGERITLRFIDMDLETGPLDCLLDYLEIREGGTERGALRNRACGNDLPSAIKSFTNSLWLRFKSNGQESAGGFQLTYTSAPADGDGFLLMPTSQNILMRHEGEGGHMTLPLYGVYNPMALEFDPVERRVYWSDTGIGEIRSAYLNGSDWKTLWTHSGETSATSLALDPVSRLLFFNEMEKGVIVMLSLVTGHHRTVVSGLIKPVSIVVHPADGTVFWLDQRTSSLSSVISKAKYDGTQQRHIITRHLGAAPCLALDAANKRLYWVDASSKKIEWSDLEGKGRSSQVMALRNTIFYAITVSEDHLYVIDFGIVGVDSGYSLIRQLEKDGSNITLAAIFKETITDIHYHKDNERIQPGRCAEKNGGCSHLCIPTDTPVQTACLCPDLHVLQADKKTCTPRPVYDWLDDDEDEDEYEDEDEDDELFQTIHDWNTIKNKPVTHIVDKPTLTPLTPTRRSSTEPFPSKPHTGNTIVISKDDFLTRPVTANVFMLGPTPFDTDGSQIMKVSCVFSGSATVVWRGGMCMSVESHVCLVKPKIPDDDGSVIRCEAYLEDGRYGRSSFTVQLNYPPPLPPQIRGYKTGQVLTVGDRLRMTCVVKGGKPLVSAVDFYCSGHPDTEPDEESGTEVEASVTIKRLTSSDNGVMCVCSAEWKKPEMYTEKTYVTLRVVKADRSDL